MINFPLIESLSVDGFELYPGPAEDPGLHASFRPGVTLILGANGLGKSTLVHLLFRMLSGNAELRGSGFDALGSGQLEIRNLYPQELRTFAARVGDAAAAASATIGLSIGSVRFSVTRELASLTLTALSVDEEVIEADEAEFRRAIIAATNLDDFIEWILVLRYLVFYFDDRRSLVWDPTAQRRLLPLLFIAPDLTEPIRELTNTVLSKDSAVRNLNAALAKQEREMRAEARAELKMPLVQAELADLIQQRGAYAERLKVLHASVGELESARADARLNYLRAVDNREALAAELDMRRIQHVRAAFPSSAESAAYILAHLLDEADCLVCGTRVPAVAAALRKRVDDERCVVCDSSFAVEDADAADGQDLISLRQRLADARENEDLARQLRSESEAIFGATLSEISLLERSINDLSVQIDRLEAQLPEKDRSANKRREAIASLKASNEIAREEVFLLKRELATLVERQNRELSAYKESIKGQFDYHARDFLVEDCSLTWASHPEQIGQLGRGIEFSVFQIELSGGSVSGLTRRAGAQQVSESQREFIDLAFRMALINVAGARGVGTIVIDAPESSLDAVFAPRAANVLTRFGEGDDQSRMIITSNLVDGQLIPQIALLAGIPDAQSERVINLFRIAAKTAALRQFDAEYAAALDRAFKVPGS